MCAVIDAYDLHITRMIGFYQRLNQLITYPDGMTTSLGIIYWGRDEHLREIEKATLRLLEIGISRFNEVLRAIRTPARLRILSDQTGISDEILKILKHDIDLWLPKPVPLDQLEWFQSNPDCLKILSHIGLGDQLTLITAGQTPSQREEIALRTKLDVETVDEMVRLCDYHRTGKNLGHIRARIYYDMGLNTWQKWAEQTSETIISMFTAYIQKNHLEGERLIPWPKEVRNGIEWAKLHLEIYSVQW